MFCMNGIITCIPWHPTIPFTLIFTLNEPRRKAVNEQANTNIKLVAFPTEPSTLEIVRRH